MPLSNLSKLLFIIQDFLLQLARTAQKGLGRKNIVFSGAASRKRCFFIC